MNDQDRSSILLYRASDAIEGALLQAMLEENGIEVWVSGGQAAIGFGELGADALRVSLHVRQGNAAEAKRLVEAFWRDREGAGSGPWTCATCGEGNETGYEACWSCGAVRPLRDRDPGVDGSLETERVNDSKWTRWDVRAVRLYLGLSLAGTIALFYGVIGQLLGPALSPLLERVGVGAGLRQTTVFVTVFLIYWLPVAALIARWVFSKPPARSETTEG